MVQLVSAWYAFIRYTGGVYTARYINFICDAAVALWVYPLLVGYAKVYGSWCFIVSWR